MISGPTKYRIGRRIGGGGMAEVLEAEVVGAEGFARPVAIKRILPALSTDPNFDAMFRNEARIASLLHHPNVVSVLDFDVDEQGRYFLVMELVGGIDLRTLQGSGLLPLHVAVHLAIDILGGLTYAHELMVDGKHLNIVHRDLSPHNVMVTWSGTAKVVDFGIAKALASTDASRSGSLKGKVGYMSPEQAHGDIVDGRSDVFAAGVILHEMLTGQRLWGGVTEPEILARLIAQPIPRPRERNPRVDRDVDDVVMAMLERDLDGRIASARDAVRALLGCAAAKPGAALDLAELLGERFPDRVPPSADVSGPNAAPHAVVAAAASSRRTLVGHVPAEASGKLRVPEHTPPEATRTHTPLLSNHEPRPASAEAPPTRPARTATGRRAIVLGAGALGAAAGLGLWRTTRSRPDGARSSAAGPAAPDAVPDSAAGAALPDGVPGPAGRAETGETQPESSMASLPTADAPPTNTMRTADAGPADTMRTADAAPLTDRADLSQGAPVASGADSTSAESKPSILQRAAAAPRRKRKRKGKGKVRVMVDPWAMVYVGGKSEGQTPVVLELDEGVNTITLVNDEANKRERVRVVVRGGRETPIKRDWR